MPSLPKADNFLRGKGRIQNQTKQKTNTGVSDLKAS